MRNYACKNCGGELRIHSGRMGAQCTCCGKYYDSDELYRMAKADAPDGQESLHPEPAMVGLIIIAIFVSLPFALFLPGPLYVILLAATIIAIRQYFNKHKISERAQAAGEQLRTADDYIRAFRMMPLSYMPLRAEAGEAISQLDQLKRKQIALASLLPEGHPFLQSGDNAAEYILNNSRQILFRLRYCDQNDLSLREMHAAYVHERLEENERILNDFEQLIIEVTQMNDANPTPIPSLDVLADTLRSVRGQDADEWDALMQNEQPAPAPMPMPALQTRTAYGTRAAVQTAAQEQFLVQAPPMQPAVEWNTMRTTEEGYQFCQAITLADGATYIELLPFGRTGLFILHEQKNGEIAVLPSPAAFFGSRPFSNGVTANVVRGFFDGVSGGGGSIVRIRPAILTQVSGCESLWQCALRGEIVQN